MKNPPMARVTVEDCLDNLPNRFALVVLASARARQITRGSETLVECNNKEAVTALREIAGGKVQFHEDVNEAVEDFVDVQREAGLL